MNVENQPIKIKKPIYKKWWFYVVLCFCVFVFLFVGIILKEAVSIYQKGTDVNLEVDNVYSLENLVDQKTAQFGNKDAKIKIIEFGDFGCGFTKLAYPGVREMLAKYENEIDFYWLNYPTVTETSLELALAAECARKQNKFWELHDKLFQFQGQFTLEDLPEMIKQVGLNDLTFNNCYKNESTKNKITEEFLKGEELKLKGTPTFIINGYKLEGVLKFEDWSNIIDNLESLLD